MILCPLAIRTLQPAYGIMYRTYIMNTLQSILMDWGRCTQARCRQHTTKDLCGLMLMLTLTAINYLFRPYEDNHFFSRRPPLGRGFFTCTSLSASLTLTISSEVYPAIWLRPKSV